MFCKSDVVDPWYSGDFDKAYNDIEKGVMLFSISSSLKFLTLITKVDTIQ